MRGKKGGLAMGVLFAFMFFILGMLILPFAKDQVTDSRTSLDCTNSSISDGNKTTCLMVDGTVPYLIIAILVFVGGFIGNEL